MKSEELLRWMSWWRTMRDITTLPEIDHPTGAE